MSKLKLGNPDKVYAGFKEQLDDDKGFREMVLAYYDAGGRKQAEIEYQLEQFIAKLIDNPVHEVQYMELAVRLLKINAEWFRLFADEMGRLK